MKHTPENNALEQRIREMADSIKVPPSLEPENFIKRLPDRRQAPIIRIRRYIPAAAAAACLLVVLSGTFFLGEFSGDPMIQTESSAPPSPAGSTPSSAEISEPSASSEDSEESLPEQSPASSGEIPESSETPPAESSGSTPDEENTSSQPGSPVSQGQSSEPPSAPEPEPSQPEGSLQQQDISAYESAYETMLAFRQKSNVYDSYSAAPVSISDLTVQFGGDGTAAQPVQQNGNVICTLSSDADSDTIYVYSMEDPQTPAIAFQPEYQLPAFRGMHISSVSFTGLYLEGDTLTAVGTAYYWSDNGTRQREVTVLSSYDVSNPKKPAYMSTLAQDGKMTASYNESGRLALVTTYTVSPSQELSENQASSYLPVCYVNGEEILPTEEQIQISAEADAPVYTFIGLIDLRRPDEFQDILSYLGEGDTFYLDEGRIYMARAGQSQTRLTAFSYTGSRIKLDAETVVDGVIMDGFAKSPNGRSVWVSVSTQNSVSLYLMDKKLNILGQMEGFIPDADVSSVLYHGYFAHYLDSSGEFICSVDCSMPKSPEFLDQTPQNMGDLGEYYEFGSQMLKVTPVYDESGVQTGLKLIMYRDRVPVGFQELHSVVLEGPVSILGWDDPANLYLDEENGLIGFSVMDYGETVSIRYVLYSYDSKNGFVKLLDQPMEADGNQYLDYRTGICDGETFYLASPGQMLSFDMAQLKAAEE